MLWVMLVWAGCVSYAALHLRHGWVPHDAGALGESAQRVLAGQLPHRDFGEIYTGGLSMLHAAAFRVLGSSLLTLRLVLLTAFALWLPLVHAIASRLASRRAALMAVVMAAAWSIPVYPASMPSWYNLFFATAGVWALMRAFETERARWLFAAGVFGGLSCLVKITGLYFVAAALLALAFHEQTASAVHPARGGHRGGSWVVSGAAAAFALALLALVHRDLSAAVALHFVLPGAALAAVLVWRDWRAPAAPWRTRLSVAARLGGPFVAGVALPVMLFLVPYAMSGSLTALGRGVFVLPLRRLHYARVQPYGTVVYLLLAGGAWAAFRVAGEVSKHTRDAFLVLVVGALAIAPIVGTGPISYLLAWLPMRVLVPLLVTWGVVRLVRRGGADRRTDERLYLLLAAAALCSVIQFPFAEPIYFFYVAPLAVLAALALLAEMGPSTRQLAAVATLSYVAFAVVRIHPTSVVTMGHGYQPDDQYARLAVPRGGIDVSPQDSTNYEELVHLLRAHSPAGYTYATPDCPQVYFLSGLRNPTRTLFDFFDDTVGRTTRILHALAEHQVTAVTLNTARSFSGPVPRDLLAALVRRYPNGTQIGNFRVMWR